MHDNQLEDRLRTALRAEGDGLSMTITAAELQRRLAGRQRQTRGRWMTAIAAAIAFVALGAVAAMSNGWLRLPAVGVSPSPSATASPAPTSSPAPSPSGVPATPEPTPRVAEPVGSAGEAVLVKPIGSDARRPDSFEVTRFDPATGRSVVIATVPGSVLPEDGWLETFDRPPQVSPTGWLAMGFTRGPNEDETTPAIAIIDLQAPDIAPWILDGYTSMSWDLTDKLVVEREDRVWVAWPTSRFLQTFAPVGTTARIASNGAGISSGPAVTVEDSTRFLAMRTTDDAWGYVGFDGAFTPTNDLPAVYQRMGRERPAGADAHGLGYTCDGGGAPAGGVCSLVETDAKQKPVATWLDLDKTGAYDFAWAVDGKSVWVLLEGGISGGSQVATLAYASDVDSRTERARIDFAEGMRPQILGFADEPTPGSATVVAIGDDEGFIHAFVLDGGDVIEQDGTAWFAGWAVDPAPYDPD